MRLQFFLSAVTRDFGDQRDILRRRLNRAGRVHVATQEEFGPYGHATLRELEACIDQSAAVIHLVGPHAGAPPAERSVRELLQRRPALLHKITGLAENAQAVTYTQWESYLAIALDKPLYIFQPEGADLCHAQSTHLERLRQIDHYPLEFRSKDALLVEILTALLQYFEARGEPPPDVSLAAYRAQCRDAFDRLPEVFRRGAERALSDVFVEVRLAGEVGPDADALYGRSQPWKGRSPPGIHALTGPRRLAELVAFEGHRRWAMLGDPGAGKTTLLHRLGLTLLDDPDGDIPIYLRVATFKAGDGLAQLLPRVSQDAAPRCGRRWRQVGRCSCSTGSTSTPNRRWRMPWCGP